MIQEIYVIDEGDTLTGRLVDMFSQNKKIKIPQRRVNVRCGIFDFKVV